MSVSGVLEDHGEDEVDDDDNAGVAGDAAELDSVAEDWFGLEVVTVVAACRAVLAAIFSSTMGGGVCGMEPGGKRRKKLSKGFGRAFASCSYCRIEAMSSIRSPQARIDVVVWLHLELSHRT